MSDPTSSTHAAEPLPPSKDGSSRTGPEPAAGSAAVRVVRDDQATVITHRAPMASDDVSDSAVRILQGRILPGDRLGHFELVQYVGGGGMGRVFRAKDTRLARTVALKILSPEQAADRETLLRFQNEAQSAARLDHDNIARVYYVGEDRGLHYIVFEFIEGVNVRELVENKGPLPLGEAISYTLQVADALAHAASRKVVHRDIKPSNLLITPEGQIKLIDMGLARLREADKVAADLTASGVTLGTFDYISPEQARDPRNADVRSDIYSLGCTLFFMLTARPPFLGGTMLQKLLQHQGDEPPDVRQFRPDLSDDVTRVLRKMLAKDPRHRYREPSELVGDLLLMAKGLGLRRAPSGGRGWIVPTEPVIPLLYRHLPWMVPLVALIGIVVGLDYLWSHTASQETEPPAPVVGSDIAAPGETIVSRDLDGAGPEETPLKPLPAMKEKGAVRPPAPEAPPEPVAPPAKPVSSSPGVDASSGLEGTPQVAPAAAPALADPLRPGRGSDSDASGNAMASGRAATPPVVGVDREVPPPPKPVAVEEPAVELSAKVPTKQAGVLIVSPRAQGANAFATLKAACMAASEARGDVIELCYNGPREEQPIKLSNTRVTIRAGDGYQPVVVFRPTETDPLRCPRSMITASAGRLSIVNVAMELIVPREVAADSWSLFEIHGSQSVRLDKCSLSIRNASDQLGAYNQEVAFFRARPASDASAEAGDAPPGTAPVEAATIDLADCLARGEAVLLRSEELQPVRLNWDNGLLIISERLLSAAGGPKAAQFGEMVRLDLRHVTAIVRGGFARLASSQLNPHQLIAQIDCADTILSTTPGGTLVEQTSDDDLDDLRQRVIWNGDRGFYEGFDAFWAVRRLNPSTPPDLMMFDGWKAYWGPEHENLPKVGKVEWKKPPGADRPMCWQTAADYALSEVASNPAVGTASDGHNAGCMLDRLPILPPEPLVPRPR